MTSPCLHSLDYTTEIIVPASQDCHEDYVSSSSPWHVVNEKLTEALVEFHGGDGLWSRGYGHGHMECPLQVLGTQR